MLIWSQDGMSVYYLENHQYIRIDEVQPVEEENYFVISIDCMRIGEVNTLKEAQEALSSIVTAFRTAQCEVNPW